MQTPFPFLGHGAGPGTFDVILCLESAAGEAKPVVDALEAWCSTARDSFVDSHENVVSLAARRAPSPKGHESLSGVLEQAHGTTPLGLVVRRNRVKPSPWHTATLNDPERLLAVLERQVQARAGREYGPMELDISSDPRSIFAGAWSSLARTTSVGSLVQAALLQVTDAVIEAPERNRVWSDLLWARLPTWTGVNFGVDLAIVQALSSLMGIAPTTVEMPGRFKDAFEDMVRSHHGRRVGGPRKDVDWAELASVRAAMAAGKWRELQRSLMEADAAHVETLMGLNDEERVELSKHERLATMMMNIATFKMTAGDFRTALAIYDCALEGRVEAAAAANPLYAVADDNNHLGVDPVRARRYLEKCVPLGPKNAAIFLNAACLTAELGDAEETLRLLALAREHGMSVKDHRNEKVFVPIRERAEFKKLMR